MDWFTLFLVKLSQPFLLFIGGCFTLMLKIDKWWTKKTDYTRLYIRFILFFIGFIIVLIIRDNKKENEQIITDNRTTVYINTILKKSSECEEWKIERLENDITKLEKIQENALENEKQLQRLNKKR